MSDALPPGTRIGPFRIERELGRGAMSTVYLATDTRLDRQVALKFADPELVLSEEGFQRFTREAKAVARLNHPNIATLHDVGRHEDRPYIVLEYVQGRSLKDVLAEGPLATEAAARLLSDIGAALDHAHEHDVLHRDVKPANIMQRTDGRFCLLDFGLSQFEGISDLTRPGTFLGSPMYMSPEHLKGEPLVPASDLWGLGAVLYESLTGKPPFPAKDVGELIGRVTGQEPEPIEATGDAERGALIHSVKVLLSKDPEQREQVATRGRSTAPPVSHRARPIVGALLVLTALAIFLGIEWFGGDADDEIILHIDEVTLKGWPEGRPIAEAALRDAMRVRLSEYDRVRVLAATMGSAASLPDAWEIDVRGVVEGEEIRLVVEAMEPGSSVLSWASQMRRSQLDLVDIAHVVVDRIADEYGVEIFSYPAPDDLASVLAKTRPAFAVVDSLLRIDEDFEVARHLDVLSPELMQNELVAALRVWTALNKWDSEPTADRLQDLRAAESDLARINEDSPYLHLTIYLDYKQGDFVRAESRVQRLLERYDLDPSFRSWALRQHALPLLQAAEYDAVLKVLEKALELDPAAYGAHQTMSGTYKRIDKLDAALVHAQRAVALRPTYWRLQQRLAIAYSDLLRSEDAILAYRRALELGGSQEAAALLTLELLNAGRVRESREELRRTRALPPTTWGLFNIGCYWARSGEPDSAFVALEEAVDLGFTSRWIFEDPDLEPLHGLERFEQLRGVIDARIAEGQE